MIQSTTSCHWGLFQGKYLEKNRQSFPNFPESSLKQVHELSSYLAENVFSHKCVDFSNFLSEPASGKQLGAYSKAGNKPTQWAPGMVASLLASFKGSSASKIFIGIVRFLNLEFIDKS